MRNFQETCKTCKRSFISAFSIYMTALSISINFFLAGHAFKKFDLIGTYVDNLNYNLIAYVNSFIIT